MLFHSELGLNGELEHSLWRYRDHYQPQRRLAQCQALPERAMEVDGGRLMRYDNFMQYSLLSLTCGEVADFWALHLLHSSHPFEIPGSRSATQRARPAELKNLLLILRDDRRAFVTYATAEILIMTDIPERNLILCNSM
jgi:hypothetical protein